MALFGLPIRERIEEIGGIIAVYRDPSIAARNARVPLIEEVQQLGEVEAAAVRIDEQLQRNADKIIQLT